MSLNRPDLPDTVVKELQLYKDYRNLPAMHVVQPRDITRMIVNRLLNAGEFTSENGLHIHSVLTDEQLKCYGKLLDIRMRELRSVVERPKASYGEMRRAHTEAGTAFDQWWMTSAKNAPQESQKILEELRMMDGIIRKKGAKQKLQAEPNMDPYEASLGGPY